MTNIEIVRECVPESEQLAQLAEEAMELGQAALKMRRVLSGVNPTPVRIDEALASFREEIADVLLCLRVLGYDEPTSAIKEIMQAKTDRWATRLREKWEVAV